MGNNGLSENNKTSGKFRIFVLWFLRVMLLFAFVGAFYSKRDLVLLVSGISFLITFLPFLFERIFNFKFFYDVELFVVLFLYGTLFLGDIRGLYSEFWWWGLMLNLGASIILGFIGLTILSFLYKEDLLDASPLIISFFSFCFSFALGSVWELFEFFLDSFLGFNLQIDLRETMFDLVANFFGALIVSVFGYFYVLRNDQSTLSGFILKIMKKYPLIFKSGKHNIGEDILKLVNSGEKYDVEFKATLRKNLHTGEFDKNLEYASLKTLTAYLNSEGGTLLIGVSDRGEILGIEKDGFVSDDKMQLHFTNLIKTHIGADFLPYLHFAFVKIKDIADQLNSSADLIAPLDSKSTETNRKNKLVNYKKILRIYCSKSNSEVFLKTDKGEEFYVRNGPSSTRLEGKSLIDYIERRFRRK